MMGNESRAVQPVTLATATHLGRGSRLRWLLRRVAAMDRREAFGRAFVTVKVAADVISPANSRGPADPLHSKVRTNNGLSTMLLSCVRAEWVTTLVPTALDAVIATAERFASGEFQFLGYPPVLLLRPLRYDVDAFTGRSWPRKHGLLLDYRSSSVGDPKWIWELNRLQHVPLLFSVALLANNDSFAKVAAADLAAWLAQDIPGRGIAWSNGYEPALRAISLALSLDCLRDVEGETSSLGEDLLESLRHHVAWIRRYPSCGSSANNHRIGELTGLIVTAALAPELGLAEYLEGWVQELRMRCDEQFAPDGGNREQAFGYAVFTGELLLVVAGVLQSAGATVPSWLWKLLERVEQALAIQLGASDPEPRYGDSDNGGPTLLGAPFSRTGRSLLAGVRYALGRRITVAPEDLEPSTVWLFGPAERTRPRKHSGIGDWLGDIGFVVLRAGASTVTFDVGPLGFGRLAAHGHADALNVTLAHRGTLLIGDPGTGSYFGNAAVRSAFRGTSFHATVTVDSLDQAVAGGAFLWTAEPVVSREFVSVSTRVATGSHDGYCRLVGPVLHRRTVVLVSEALFVVRDVLRGDGEHTYSQRWPLAPGASVRRGGGGRFLVTIEGTTMLLETLSSRPSDARVSEGSVEPFEGWWSTALESILPAPVVSYDASTGDGVEFLTIVALGSVAAGFSRGDVEARWKDGRCVIRSGSDTVIRFFDDGSAQVSRKAADRGASE